MADRGLSAAVKEYLARTQLTVVHLFYFGFSTPDYFADGRYDIVWNGNTYLATGDILEVPQIKHTAAPSLDSVEIRISGVNQANIYKVLAEDFTGVEVKIHRALVTEGLVPASNLYPGSTMYPSSGWTIVGTPIELFFGTLDNPSVRENPEDGTSEIAWKATSHWLDFERVAGRRTNDADQQKWFPGDKGMEFASKSIADLKWGAA